MSADATIQDILAKYGEDVRSATWKVQSATVIYHRAIERIAAKAGIKFDAPQILRAERDEAVILVTGRLGDMTVWSIGEAMVNVNYRVSGKQAAYVWAMAEKRAVDRVVLKLIGLHGIVYSENEADEFKAGRGSDQQQSDDVVRPMTVEHMLHELSACQEPDEIDALQKDPSFRLGYKQASKADQQRIVGEGVEVRRRVNVGGAA